jgi:hypothetical protein
MLVTFATFCFREPVGFLVSSFRMPTHPCVYSQGPESALVSFREPESSPVSTRTPGILTSIPLYIPSLFPSYTSSPPSLPEQFLFVILLLVPLSLYCVLCVSFLSLPFVPPPPPPSRKLSPTLLSLPVSQFLSSFHLSFPSLLSICSSLSSCPSPPPPYPRLPPPFLFLSPLSPLDPLIPFFCSPYYTCKTFLCSQFHPHLPPPPR